MPSNAASISAALRKRECNNCTPKSRRYPLDRMQQPGAADIVKNSKKKGESGLSFIPLT
jgi:hypothetical protein